MRAERPQAHPTRLMALVVDGAFGCREIGSAFLSEFDLDVRCAPTSDAAIDCLTRHASDIAVVMTAMDVPGRMDGATFARSVSILWPAITLIVTSDTPEGRAREFPQGVVRLRTPWRPLDIVAASERAARADHSVRSLRL